ncbi:MAG: DMT family transporter [Hyphomicrobiaceae bacterium]
MTLENARRGNRDRSVEFAPPGIAHAGETAAGPAASPASLPKPLWLRFAPLIFLMLWSAGYAVAKIGLRGAEPFTFLALRYVAVIAVLFPSFPSCARRCRRAPAEWMHLAVVGLLIQGLYFGMCYIAFWLDISTGAIALILALQPILVALLAPALAGEQVTWRRWLGLVLGLAGAGIVIWARSRIATDSISGLAAAVAALLAITAGTLYEKRFGTSRHPVTSNLVQFAVGLAVIAPFALFLEKGHVDWTPSVIASFAYLVIGNSLIATTLLLAMIRHGEASRVSALLFLVPPIAAVIAWLLLEEFMPPLAWPGLVLAALGVWLATRADPAQPKRP